MKLRVESFSDDIIKMVLLVVLLLDGTRRRAVTHDAGKDTISFEGVHECRLWNASGPGRHLLRDAAILGASASGKLRSFHILRIPVSLR